MSENMAKTKKTGKLLNKRNLIILLILLIVIAAAAIIILRLNNKSDENVDNSISVETMSVEYGELSTVNTYVATTEATKSVNIIPKISGEVLTLNVKNGDKVSVGDVLFKVDDKVAQLSLEQANSAYNQALINQEQGILNADNAILNANSALEQAKIATDQAEYNQNLSSKSSDKNVELLESNKAQALSSAQASLQSAQNSYDKLVLTKEQTIDSGNASINSQKSQRTAYKKERTAAQTKLNALDPEVPENASQIATLKAEIAGLDAKISALDSAINSADTSLDNTEDSYSIQIKGAQKSIDLAKESIENIEKTYDIQIEQAQLSNNSQDDTKKFLEDGNNEKLSQAQNAVNSANDGKSVALKSYGAQIFNASLGIENAQLALDNYTTKAPISGTVSNVTLKKNNMASPSAIALTINNKDSISIKFDVSEKVQKNIHIDDKISVDVLSSKKAVITEISEVANPTNGLFSVTAIVEDTNSKILPGQNVTIKLTNTKTTNKIVIPYDSVFFNGEQAYVYVAEDNKAIKKNVEIGDYNDTDIVITSGLQPEEVIITTWAATLRDKAPIAIIDKSKEGEDN